jgi:hypothetical protein
MYYNDELLSIGYYPGDRPLNFLDWLIDEYGSFDTIYHTPADLAREYDIIASISKTTIRNYLKQLEEDGYLEPKKVLNRIEYTFNWDKIETITKNPFNHGNK